MRTIGLVVVLLVAAASVAKGGQQQPSPSTQAQEQPGASPDVSYSAAEGVLRDLKKGIEAHSVHRILAVFDPEKMDGYLQFQGQLTQFMNQWDGFRVHYRIIQSSVDGSKTIALVELQMEAAPRDEHSNSLRRDQQVRFVLDRKEKGWKIVDFQPRGYFIQ